MTTSPGVEKSSVEAISCCRFSKWPQISSKGSMNSILRRLMWTPLYPSRVDLSTGTASRNFPKATVSTSFALRRRNFFMRPSRSGTFRRMSSRRACLNNTSSVKISMRVWRFVISSRSSRGCVIHCLRSRLPMEVRHWFSSPNRERPAWRLLVCSKGPVVSGNKFRARTAAASIRIYLCSSTFFNMNWADASPSAPSFRYPINAPSAPRESFISSSSFSTTPSRSRSLTVPQPSFLGTKSVFFTSVGTTPIRFMTSTMTSFSPVVPLAAAGNRHSLAPVWRKNDSRLRYWSPSTNSATPNSLCVELQYAHPNFIRPASS
mmetsp:Transcript_133621/g.231755  ORF Transcript_133621/g.231755 Transcript_133621/m.231755 type:complete len:319 (-) Transcript_133621:465-1421(-)